MPNQATPDVLRTQTAEVIEASLKMCCSSRDNLTRSESVVILTRQTIASSIALLNRIKLAGLVG